MIRVPMNDLPFPSPISSSAPVPASAWYALRRTLPPWRLEELLSELEAHAQAYGLDEVIVMVDAEECFHGHPTPDIAAGHAVNLMKVKTALAKIGVAYSLNPWICLFPPAAPGMSSTRLQTWSGSPIKRTCSMLRLDSNRWMILERVAG